MLKISHTPTPLKNHFTATGWSPSPLVAPMSSVGIYYILTPHKTMGSESSCSRPLAYLRVYEPRPPVELQDDTSSRRDERRSVLRRRRFAHKLPCDAWKSRERPGSVPAPRVHPHRFLDVTRPPWDGAATSWRHITSRRVPHVPGSEW